ncbi:MAG: CBS domain-containing protein [Candidatus Nanopelagicales bacterium]
MLARDLAILAPVLRPQEPAIEALHLLTTSGLPGVVIHDGRTYTVVPASQVLRVVLPQYVLDDPSLGRVWDEASADTVADRLAGLHISDLLDAVVRDDDWPEPAVGGDATVVEIAATMASAHTPLVAVVEGGKYIGMVGVLSLVAHLLG